jgi:hypothetical protein
MLSQASTSLELELDILVHFVQKFLNKIIQGDSPVQNKPAN